MFTSAAPSLTRTSLERDEINFLTRTKIFKTLYNVRLCSLSKFAILLKGGRIAMIFVFKKVPRSPLRVCPATKGFETKYQLLFRDDNCIQAFDLPFN